MKKIESSPTPARPYKCKRCGAQQLRLPIINQQQYHLCGKVSDGYARMVAVKEKNEKG